MVVTSLISLWFHTFSLVFSKKTLFTNFRKSFSKSSFAFSSYVFMSIYSFKLTFWLNLMTLCTFINNYPWLNPCFKFRKCITHSSLSWKFATSFSIVSNFHSFRQKGKSFRSLCKFSGYWISTSRKNILCNYHRYSFFMKYSSISVVSSDHLKLPEGNFCDIAQTEKMNYIPIFKIRRLLILIMILYVFVISFCISIESLTYSSSDILFYH